MSTDVLPPPSSNAPKDESDRPGHSSAWARLRRVIALPLAAVFGVLATLIVVYATNDAEPTTPAAPAAVQVPSVVGQTFTVASQTLASAGLSATGNPSPTTITPDAIVVSQSPVAGASVPSGGSIVINSWLGDTSQPIPGGFSSLYGSSTYSSPSYSSPSYSTPSLPSGSFTDGTYEVGSGVGEIAPGTYKTSGGSGSSCYFARLEDTAGTDIIDNNLSSGPMVMTVKGGDGAVELSGGCTWSKK